MKKKVKKIPKYAGGIASASNAMLMNVAGIEDNSTAGVMLNSTAQGADVGGSIVPGWGHLIGGAAGAMFGAFQKGGVDPNTGEIQYGGIFGHSGDYLRRKSNRTKSSIMTNAATQNIRADYYNGIGYAEGGVIREPVEALVSPGELEIDPITLQYREFPGDNNEPNSDDNIGAILGKGRMIASNSEEMIMENGKTPADNSKMILDSKIPEEMKRKLLKKVINWLERNKTKPLEYAKYALGEDEILDVKIDPVKINPPILDKNWDKSTKTIMDEIIADSLKKISNRIPRIKGKDKNNNKWASYAQLGLSALLALKKETPEKVMYSTPVFKEYMPVDVDVTKQLREVDDSYALSRYNFANAYSGSGAGMAAGLQAAATRAKQRADVRQYQTNEQNKLIGQNIGLYNNWQTMNSNIMNQVYDKIDANNAAARNINRENMKAFSKNIGMYGRDLAGWDNNLLQIMALQGLGDYGYSNWNGVLKQLKKFT